MRSNVAMLQNTNFQKNIILCTLDVTDQLSSQNCHILKRYSCLGQFTAKNERFQNVLN